MRRFARPDLSVLQPVKYKHGRNPWREGDSDLERMARLLLKEFWHIKNTSTIINYRILDLSAGSLMYDLNEKVIAMGLYVWRSDGRL